MQREESLKSQEKIMPCGQTELQEFTRYFLKVDVQFVTKIKMEINGEN